MGDIEARLDSLEVNQRQTQQRVRTLEKYFDTLQSPWYKRLWWKFDGWGPWYYVRTKRAWRPWHGN